MHPHLPCHLACARSGAGVSFAAPLWALVWALALALLFGTAPAQAIEEPRYQVERVLEPDRLEIRRYEPYVVAEVVVPGPAEKAGNQGFAYLGGYIFGRNKGDRSIAMTAPVIQTPQPTKIAMTAPVAQSAVAGGYAVQFMMPSSFRLETLPEPLDPQVQLKPVAAQRVLVLRYSGTWSQAHYDEQLERLLQAARNAHLQAKGEPVYARYNGPWVPWFLRRNEIWLPIDDAAPSADGARTSLPFSAQNGAQ